MGRSSELDGLTTLPELLMQSIQKNGDREALRQYDRATGKWESWTYKELGEHVLAWRRAFAAMGLKPGERIAILMPNGRDHVCADQAALANGLIPVPLHAIDTPGASAFITIDSQAATLVTNKLTRWQQIRATGVPLPDLKNIIITDPGETEDKSEGRFHIRSLESILLEGASWTEDLPAGPLEDDLAGIIYTSGTTGRPKGVMLTHYNVVNNGKAIGDCMDLSTADRLMIQVPMFHCFGMVLAMTAAMTHGTSMSPIPYFSPRVSLDCINKKKITAFHGVPTMFIAMLGHADFAKTDFSHMRTGIMAGSPCPIKTMRDVTGKMHLSELTITYGQTECSPGMTMSRTDDPLELRCTTVGKLLPQTEGKIIDPETGKEVPRGVPGEIVTRGYHVMKGYYKMPEATRQAIDEDGWLHTGDIGTMDEDGNFRITGRLKDMIIRGGENIYPREIEEFLYTHPAVSDVQVVGVPDEKYGEEVCACVILKKDCTATKEELIEFVREGLSKFKAPRYVLLMDSFPMTASGKIQKFKLREMGVDLLGLHAAANIETA